MKMIESLLSAFRPKAAPKPVPCPPCPPVPQSTWVAASACVAETMQGFKEYDPPPLNIDALIAPAIPEWNGVCEVHTTVPMLPGQTFIPLFLPVAGRAATASVSLTLGAGSKIIAHVTCFNENGMVIRAPFFLIIVGQE